MNTRRGFGLIEVVVGVALLLAVVLSLMALYVRATRVAQRNVGSVAHIYLLEEGAEIVRHMRDVSWDTIAALPTDTPQYVTLNEAAGYWEVTGTPEVIDEDYARSITFYDVYRDSNDDIVDTGGTLDPDTLLATVEVVWTSGYGVSTRTLSFYIADVFDN